MIEVLLDNSVLIIGFLVISLVGYREYRRYLQRKGITSEQFRVSFRENLNKVSPSLLTKLAMSVCIAVIISVISFRSLFVNDVFHTVFLTILMAPTTYKVLRRLFE